MGGSVRVEGERRWDGDLLRKKASMMAIESDGFGVGVGEGVDRTVG